MDQFLGGNTTEWKVGRSSREELRGRQEFGLIGSHCSFELFKFSVIPGKSSDVISVHDNGKEERKNGSELCKTC